MPGFRAGGHLSIDDRRTHIREAPGVIDQLCGNGSKQQEAGERLQKTAPIWIY
jgi:hypothetical protein